MKNLYSLVRRLSLSVLFAQMLLSPAFAQITLIPNPTASGSFVDPLDTRSPYPSVEYNNALYGRYVDTDSKGHLAKFEGTSITIIPNPNNERGVFGQLFVFNGAIYMQYLREVPYPLNPSINIGIGYIAKYDGQSLRLLENPDINSSGVNSGFIYPALFTTFNGSLYGQYFDANNRFRLAKIDSGPISPSFSITGVTSVSCTTVTATERRLSFTPQYAGLTGQPVSFSVVNELALTQNPGPYSLRLYVDNPMITLKATQNGTPNEASYMFNWLGYCLGGGRMATAETQTELGVVVMPNPTSDQTVAVEVRGASTSPINYEVTDEQGRIVSQLRVEQAGSIERRSLRLGSLPGMYLIKVSVLSQTKTVKVVKQ